MPTNVDSHDQQVAIQQYTAYEYLVKSDCLPPTAVHHINVISNYKHQLSGSSGFDFWIPWTNTDYQHTGVSLAYRHNDGNNNALLEK